METATASDPQAQGGYFALIHINAGGIPTG